MADIVNLATFEFDSDRLEANLKKSQDRLIDLRIEQQRYNDLARASQKIINELASANLKLADAEGDNTDAIEENNKLMAEATEAYRQNSINALNVANNMRSVRGEITQTETQLRAYMNGMGEFQSLQDQANAAIEREIRNKNEARAANLELQKISNQLNPSIAEEAQLLTKVNAQIDSNTQFIKNNSSETAKQKMSVGGYTEAIREAFKESGLLGGALQALGPVGNTVVVGFNAIKSKAGEVTDSFKNYRASQEEIKTANAALVVAQQASTAATQAAAAANERATVVGFAYSQGKATQTEVDAANTAAKTANATATEAQAAATVSATTAQTALANGTRLTTVATKAWSLALAATGIGLIIAAVGLLINYFKSFTPIVDVVEQAFSGLGSVVKVIQQGIVSFIKGLSDLGGTLKKVGSFLANPIQGFRDMTKSMGEAYDAAVELTKAQQDLEDAMALQEIATAKNRSEIEKLNIQSKDRTKTDEERVALLQKAAKLEEEDFNQRKVNADEALRIAQQQIINEAKLTEAEVAQLQKRGFAYKEYVETRTNNTDELFDALKAAELAQIELDRELTSNLEKNINRQNKLLEDQEKEAEDRRKKAEEAERKRVEAARKAAEDMVKAMQLELDFYIESQNGRKKSLEDQIKTEEEIMRQSLAIAQTELDKKLISRKEYDLKVLQAQNEFGARQVELVIDNADKELEAFINANQRKIEEGQFFNDELYYQELDRLNRISEEQAYFATLQYQQGILNEREYRDAIAAIDQEYYDAQQAVDAERAEAEAAQKAANLALEVEAAGSNFDYDLQLQMKQYQAEYDAEKAAAVKNGADMLLFEKAQAEKKKQIEQAVQQNKLQLASDAFGSLAAIAGEESAAGKAFAVAQATIDTYASATSAFNSLSGIPIVGPVLGGIAAAAAVAAGIANVKKILSVKTPTMEKKATPSYASGVIGVRGAGTGTSDSIAANISAGESVMTARATSMFPNTLSAINQAGGGVGLDGELSSTILQNGLQNRAESTMNIEVLAEAVALGAQRGTQQGAADGMIGLAQERAIQQNARV